MKDYIKDYIIVALLLRDFYNMDGWSVDGFWKVLIFGMLVCCISTIIYTLGIYVKQLLGKVGK